MAEESIAFSTVSPAGSSEDEGYEALHAALAETAQGRWFLQEYARRHRAADTQLLLGAIGRLEGTLSMNESAEIAPQIYAQLLDATKAIAQARAQIEETASALASAADDEYRAQMLGRLLPIWSAGFLRCFSSPHMQATNRLTNTAKKARDSVSTEGPVVTRC
jgi:hypothetical protein